MASTDPRFAAARSLVLATRSAGKVRELRALLHEGGIAAVDLEAAGVARDAREDTLERFSTFEENARAKAEWYAARLPGQTVLAEDSGLEVRALGGAPGVWSKRWAGHAQVHASALEGEALDLANNDALVRAMLSVADRAARYTCVAVLMLDATVLATARGECAGRIVEAPRGEGGFGYDPWFESEELGRTFAEASMEEKALVSHRARAVRQVIELLERAVKRE